ncbi:MAG TPA: hypothetical protein VMW95_03385 [Desulfobacterales bacterium]|nr:hypothetical protein [Desulfobacterales bacterium]
MNKLLNGIIFVASIYGFFFAIVLAANQRAFFGKETANFLLIPEIVILGLAGLAIFIYKKTKASIGHGCVINFCFMYLSSYRMVCTPRPCL